MQQPDVAPPFRLESCQHSKQKMEERGRACSCLQPQASEREARAMHAD